jgi:drug/metabolite transporter (DMT)-like permease
VTVVFALLAAAVYGVSDFLGGVVSRKVSAVTVLLYSYPVGAVLMIALLPFFNGPVSGRTVLWGLLGGVAGCSGVLMLYAGLATAPMNVISPITAVLAAGVPVVVGVALDERPAAIAWLGIALGLIAVILIGRTPQDHPHGPLPGRALLVAVLAGLGFGFYFVCLARADSDSGLWPVVLARLSASVLIFAVAAARRRDFARLQGRVLALAASAGALDAFANLWFLLAARAGYLSVASVITALYPAGTVLLAVWLLKERVGGFQKIGLVLAAGSVVLVTR